MAIKIDGKETSKAVRARIKDETGVFVQETGITPGLAVVIVGSDPASQVYVRNKHKACAEVGMYSEVHELPENVSEKELLMLIDRLNHDDRIHGILVQLPLPRHLNETAVILAIDPAKDVDAFHPQNVGKIMIGNARFLPCTPAGVMELLHFYGIDPAGKHCVIVGRSNIVGKPQSMLMLKENATVTQKIRAIKANDESILIPTPIIPVGTKICTDRFFIYSKKILLSPADCPDSVSVIAQLFPVSSPQYSRYCRASS